MVNLGVVLMEIVIGVLVIVTMFLIEAKWQKFHAELRGFLTSLDAERGKRRGVEWDSWWERHRAA